jgi:hypothetical protein
MWRSVFNTIVYDSDDVTSRVFIELCPFCSYKLKLEDLGTGSVPAIRPEREREVKKGGDSV